MYVKHGEADDSSAIAFCESKNFDSVGFFRVGNLRPMGASARALDLATGDICESQDPDCKVYLEVECFNEAESLPCYLQASGIEEEVVASVSNAAALAPGMLTGSSIDVDDLAAAPAPSAAGPAGENDHPIGDLEELRRRRRGRKLLHS